jgi:hypothetical protein
LLQNPKAIKFLQEQAGITSGDITPILMNLPKNYFPAEVFEKIW